MVFPRHVLSANVVLRHRAIVHQQFLVWKGPRTGCGRGAGTWRLCALALLLTVQRRAQLKLQYCILAAMILHIEVLRFDWVHILVSSNKVTELMLVELAENLNARLA